MGSFVCSPANGNGGNIFTLMHPKVKMFLLFKVSVIPGSLILGWSQPSLLLSWTLTEKVLYTLTTEQGAPKQMVNCEKMKVLCSVSQKFSSPIATFFCYHQYDRELITYQWYVRPFNTVKSHFSFSFPSPCVALKCEYKTLSVTIGENVSANTGNYSFLCLPCLACSSSK